MRSLSVLERPVSDAHFWETIGPNLVSAHTTIAGSRRERYLQVRGTRKGDTGSVFASGLYRRECTVRNSWVCAEGDMIEDGSPR